jgi:hypothetical protein
VDYDPGGVSAISPLTMASLLPSGFLIPWACSTTLAFSGLNSFTLTDYGLLSPCLRFTHTVTRINAKLGSDGRLTLSGWLLSQLDSPGFAWRTKNSLLGGSNIQKRQLCVKGFYISYFLPPAQEFHFFRFKKG